jgi:hsp70-interacting protein
VLLTLIFVLFSRKALNLTHYLLSESHSDCSIFAQLGFPYLMMRLASSNDSGVREAALGGLLELARDMTLGNRSLLAYHDRLRGILRGRIESIRTMTPEDLDAAREERQLVDSLWFACYHEPSLLHGEGLLFCLGKNHLNSLLMWRVDSLSQCAKPLPGGHLLVRDQIQKMDLWEV